MQQFQVRAAINQKYILSITIDLTLQCHIKFTAVLWHAIVSAKI